MDRELILRRLRSIENVSGSIVGTAAWCSLHIQHAPLICSLVTEMMKDAAVSDSKKAALLLVLHEMLLSCFAGAASDAARRQLVQAIAVQIPIGAKAVLYGGSELSSSMVFPSTLSRVIDWWSRMRVFPTSWLDDLTALLPPEILQEQQRPSAGASSSSALQSSFHNTAATAELAEAARIIQTLLDAGTLSSTDPTFEAAQALAARLSAAQSQTATTANAEQSMSNGGTDDNDILGSFF